MFSVSFADQFIDKLLPYSTKMKDSQGSALSLMNGFHSQHTYDLMDIFLTSTVSHDFDSHNSVQRTEIVSPLLKNLVHSPLVQDKLYFSPHVYNFLNDSIRFLTNQTDMLLSSSNSLNISDIFCDLSLVKPQASTKPILVSEAQESDISLVTQPKIKMSVTVKDMACKPKSDVANNEFNVPNNVTVMTLKSKSKGANKFKAPCNVTLNLQLSNRKSKELQKRSKKRRRRQKKVQQTMAKQSASVLLDETDNCPISSPVSSPKCYSKNENGFILAAENKVQMAPSLISSFFISVESASDDDSDWDACSENGTLTEIEDFEFTGLVMTSLNSTNVSHPSYSLNVNCDISVFCQDEVDEMAECRAVLQKVNKKWKEETREVSATPRSPSKVSFPADDKLVEVLPADICERKGEWEIYAIERMRFKRRIDELEKIISPCLATKHRLAIYKKIIKSRL